METKTTDLNCMAYNSLMTKEQNYFIVVGTTIGKSHYALFSAKTLPFVLFERIPAKLDAMGKLTEGPLESLQLKTTYTDDDKAESCSIINAEGNPAVEIPGDCLTENSIPSGTAFLKSVLRAKQIPFGAEDLEELAGLSGDLKGTVVLDNQTTLTVASEEQEKVLELGRGTRTCKFDICLFHLRLMRLTASKFLGIATEHEQGKFWTIGHTTQGCGCFGLATAFEAMEPETVKDIAESIKATLAGYEEIHKAQLVAARADLATRDAAFKDLKAQVLADTKLLATAASAGDSKKLEQMDKSIKDLREKNVQLTTEMRKLDALRKAAASLNE